MAVQPLKLRPLKLQTLKLQTLKLQTLKLTVAGLLVTLVAAATPAAAADPSVSGLWQKIDEQTNKSVGWFLFTEAGDGSYQGMIAKLFLRPGDPPNQTCTACKDDRKDTPMLGLPLIRNMKQSGMYYEGGNGTNRAPVLIGKIGWNPGTPAAKPGENSMLRWSVIILGILFFLSLGRWIFQLRKFLSPPSRSSLASNEPVNDEIDPARLDAWVRSVGPEESHAPDQVEAYDS